MPSHWAARLLNLGSEGRLALGEHGLMLDLSSALAHRLLRRRHRDYESTLFEALPPIMGELPGPGVEPVVFCAADPLDLTRFGGFLAASLAAGNRTARLHVHVYGELDGTVGALRRYMEERLGPDRLTLSFEAQDEGGWAGHRRILYFQTVRFARLLQLSERTGLAFLAVDIDVLFFAPLERLAALCEGADLAARFRPEAIARGRKIRAAALYLAPTPAGRALLRQAVSRMLLHLLHGPEDFYLDQRSLYAALRRGGGHGLARLPPEVLSDDLASALLYSGKGQRKLTSLPTAAMLRFGGEIEFLAAGLPGNVGRPDCLARSAVEGRDGPGYLTYGPYLDLPKGRYELTLTYRALGEGHVWDTAHATGMQVGVQGPLPDTHGAVRQVTVPLAALEPLLAFEIRIHYSGQGRLSLRVLRLRATTEIPAGA